MFLSQNLGLTSAPRPFAQDANNCCTHGYTYPLLDGACQPNGRVGCVFVITSLLWAMLRILLYSLQWPPKVVGTVAWNCQEIDISRFIVVFHTNSPPSPLETMLRRRRNMSQDVWCTWST